MNADGNSEVEVRRIPFDLIQVDQTVQQRAAGTSQDVVSEYAEAMRNGVGFPPIDIFGNDEGPFYVGDGFHRTEAYRSVHPDATDIECRVHPGGRDDALLFACGANVRHGLPRSRADKLKAVLTLILSETWSGWSDREIARQCAVSHTYVAGVRGELATFPDADPQEQTSSTDPHSGPDSVTDEPTAAPVQRRTVRRNGRCYNMRTEQIGGGRSQPADEVRKLKQAFERFKMALSGASASAREAFVEHCREDVMALVNAPEPPDPEPPNPESPRPEPSTPEALNSKAPPEPQSPTEAGFSTVAPVQESVGRVRNLSRLTRGSAPTKSHKNAPGRHRFTSDNQPVKSKRGRPKGSVNTLSLSLRQMIIQAGENVGDVCIDKDGNRANGEGGMLGFLEWLARNEPRTYGILLRGVMPAEIKATMTLMPTLSQEEACAEMRARGLPMVLIDYLHKPDEELGPDDEPNPYDSNVIDIKPEPDPPELQTAE
jgi:hypothetical protein